MHFILLAIDKPGSVEKRLEQYEYHKAYLAKAPIKTLISGPLLANDGTTMIGSVFLLEANTKAEVAAFNADDPFARAGLWQEVNIHAFNKRVDNR
ncbi:TPA: YciI family protein [Stenotrophomonas maltophilia]|uniref:YciI family protein n=1 Tax=Stenotrophomonas TaxID=40323 RepID=UPI000C15EE15|nr:MULTISPECIES: YciI family protein [Stenotrophomonas]